MDADISAEYYEYYDLIYGDRSVDIKMWLKFADEAQGPILDVGCGTGRVLRCLAEAGHQLTGIDISAEAIRQANNKVTTSNVSFLQADMCDFEISQKDFALALLIHNTFLYCLSLEDQLGCLQSIHRHLRKGGRLLIDISTPPNTRGAPDIQGQFHFGREFVGADGCVVHWQLMYTANLSEQIANCIQLLDKIDEEGIVRRAVIRFRQRVIYRREMELLLKMSGFEVDAIYGDYELNPLAEHSQKMIFVARKEDTDQRRDLL